MESSTAQFLWRQFAFVQLPKNAGFASHWLGREACLWQRHMAWLHMVPAIPKRYCQKKHARHLHDAASVEHLHRGVF